MKRIAYIFLLATSLAIGQQQQIDSLNGLLDNTSDSFDKAKLSLTLASLHERIDLNKGKSYAYDALKYKENDSLLAETNNQLGRFHFFTAQLDSASYYFDAAKTILKNNNDEKRAAIINISLGAIQLRQGNYENTIKILTESASFFEDTKDELNAAKCYSNISSAFAELDNYDKAIEYSEKALARFLIRIN